MWNIRSGAPQVIELAEAHIAKYIGEVKTVLHEKESDHLHIDVHVIPPNSRQPFYTLITTGMSDLAMNVPEGMEDWQYAELLICLPPGWPISLQAFQEEKNYWPIRWLKMLARYPYEADTWLAMDHSIPNGDPPEPLADNTKMCGILLSPPIFFDEDFFELSVTPNKTIHFYQLIPIHLEEMNFKIAEGSEALWEKFESTFAAETLLDVNRASAC